METVRLMAHRRGGTGNGAARRLRRQGQLPAVLHGYGAEEAISVDAKMLQGILQSEASENLLIDLFINGEPPERCHARLRALQTDAVSLALLHADFYRVSIDRTGSGDAAGTAERILEDGTAKEQEEASGNPVYMKRRREAWRAKEILC